MTETRITISVQYHARCLERCGWSTVKSTLDAANEAAAVHRAEHVLWETNGARLRGQVFGIEDLPWSFQVVWDANKKAIADGYKYVAWNGWVYRVDEFNENGRVCMADHVPR